MSVMLTNIFIMEEPYYIENLIRNAIEAQKAAFKGTKEEFEALTDEKLPGIISGITKVVMDEVFKYCVDDKNDFRKWELKTLKKINRKYGVAIRLFEAFIDLNAKISSITYNKYFKLFDNIDDQIKLDTLIANHVRACQVANEVKVLVANGYADGAHARWRTLHEICITFLYLYDSDYETIEMYNSYEVIDSWRKARDYKEGYEQLGFDEMTEAEWHAIDEERNKLIVKFGKEYAESYGWTMQGLPKGKRNIKELEKLVNKDYLRAVYAWSSENVHAGVSIIRQKLSLRENQQHKFLPGPNDCGFLDPVQYTSYSLTEMSTVLLGMEDSLMNKILEELLIFFQNELVKEFDKLN